MKNVKRVLLVSALLFMVFSCGKSQEEKEKEIALYQLRCMRYDMNREFLTDSVTFLSNENMENLSNGDISMADYKKRRDEISIIYDKELNKIKL